MKINITKSRSGHYTVSVRRNGWTVASVGKLSLHEAREIASQLRLVEALRFQEG